MVRAVPGHRLTPAARSILAHPYQDCPVCRQKYTSIIGVIEGEPVRENNAPDGRVLDYKWALAPCLDHLTQKEVARMEANLRAVEAARKQKKSVKR
jgi:hypothetical protein